MTARKRMSPSFDHNGGYMGIKLANNAVSRLAVPKARNWEVQVNGTARIEQITLATSPRELNTV